MVFKKGMKGYSHWNNRHLSEGHKNKISESCKGKKKPCSEEHKKKIGEAMKGCVGWNKGKNISIEQKRKMSIAHKGKHHSENTKQKLRDMNIGKRLSENTKQKISETRKRLFREGKLKVDSKWSYTKPELRFMEICEKHSLPFKYVGNGQIWINGKNPDFINIDGRKEVVEIFGRYWHSPLSNKNVPYERTYKGTIEHYKEYGFKCKIFWDDELKNEQKVITRLS